MTPIKLTFKTMDGVEYMVFGQLSDVAHTTITQTAVNTAEMLDGTRAVVVTEIKAILGMEALMPDDKIELKEELCDAFRFDYEGHNLGHCGDSAAFKCRYTAGGSTNPWRYRCTEHEKTISNKMEKVKL